MRRRIKRQPDVDRYVKKSERVVVSPLTTTTDNIDSWSVMLGAWSRKTPKKRLFRIERGTQS
jgi:hypothetical protein